MIRARKKNTNEYRAIKLISKDDNFSIEIIQNEVNLMKKLENNNSIKIFEQYNSNEDFAIVMELCDCNLAKRLSETSNGCEVDEIKMILTQLNNTFKIMVDNKIIHRDIKLENILVKYVNGQRKKYTVKLSDYGISKQLGTLSRKNRTNIGTTKTMAPEIMKEEPYDNKCDLWSIGVIIYQLCFKQFPYTAETTYSLINQINNLKQKHFKKKNNQHLDDLISKLLNPNPKERLTWAQYFNHPFFK